MMDNLDRCQDGAALQPHTSTNGPATFHCIYRPVMLLDVTIVPAGVDGSPSSAIVLALVGLILAQAIHIATNIATHPDA